MPPQPDFHLTPADLYCAMCFAQNHGLTIAAQRYARAITAYAAHEPRLGGKKLYIHPKWLANAIAVVRIAGLDADRPEPLPEGCEL